MSQFPAWAAGSKITSAALSEMVFNVAVKPSAQQVTNSTTAVADNDLQFALAANATYIFDAYVVYSTPSGANFQVGFCYTGTQVTSSWAPDGLSGSPNSDTGSVRRSVGTVAATVSAGGCFTLTVGTFTGNSAVLPNGMIQTTSAGTLELMWTQNTANVSATTVAAGSWLRALRVA